MLRERRLAGGAVLTRFVAVATAGAVLMAAEMVVHILMSSEADAVGSGASAPLFQAHVVMQAIATPVFGIGIIGVALLGGFQRRWGGPILGVIGAIGAVGFGLSGPLVAIAPSSWEMLLFIGLVPVSVWLTLTAARTLWATLRRPKAALV